MHRFLRAAPQPLLSVVAVCAAGSRVSRALAGQGWSAVRAGTRGDGQLVLFEFGECAGAGADGVWLAGGERMPGAYLGVQGVLSAVEGEDGGLGFGFEVRDPVVGDPGPGVLAGFADAADLLAAAAGEFTSAARGGSPA